MTLNTHSLARTLIAVALASGITAYGAETTSLPPEQVQGDISYVSGGIGGAEAKAFQQAASNYPLTLEFVLRTKAKDEFLAAIKTTIKDRAAMTVLNTVSAGPFLLVKLPPGQYQVIAERQGVTKTHHVDIKAGQHIRVIFAWLPTPGQN